MTTTSYWLEDAREPLPKRRLAGRVDVAVVGGGVTGCACALRLAEGGVSVRLHEAREIAGGASGRNGGFALRGAAPAYDVARRELGSDRAGMLWRLTERGLNTLESLAGDAFRRTGSLRLAADEPEAEELRSEYEALRADGFDYWQQTPDGRLVAGGFRDRALEEEFTVEEATTDVVQRALEGFIEELLGTMPPIEQRWAGIFGITADLLPLAGRLPDRDGTWAACGYSGHGNVLGLACGELVANAILGRTTPELELFDPSRLIAV